MIPAQKLQQTFCCNSLMLSVPNNTSDVSSTTNETFLFEADWIFKAPSAVKICACLE